MPKTHGSPGFLEVWGPKSASWHCCVAAVSLRRGGPSSDRSGIGTTLWARPHQRVPGWEVWAWPLISEDLWGQSWGVEDAPHPRWQAGAGLSGPPAGRPPCLPSRCSHLGLLVEAGQVPPQHELDAAVGVLLQRSPATTGGGPHSRPGTWASLPPFPGPSLLPFQPPSACWKPRPFPSFPVPTRR